MGIKLGNVPTVLEGGGDGEFEVLGEGSKSVVWNESGVINVITNV